MSPITDEKAAALAKELNEAIPASIQIAQLDRESQIKVVAKFLDGLIGTDETALISSAPYMTPEITEYASDAVINALAEAIVKKWFGPADPEPVTEL
jgi:hypothetical protein